MNKFKTLGKMKKKKKKKKTPSITEPQLVLSLPHVQHSSCAGAHLCACTHRHMDIISKKK